MPFKPNNNANPKGRTPGSKNRNKKPLRNRIEDLLLKNFDRLEQDIEMVSPEMRLGIIGSLAGFFNQTNKQDNEQVNQLKQLI